MSRGNLVLAIIFSAVHLAYLFQPAPTPWTYEDQQRLERKMEAIDIMTGDHYEH